MNKIIQYILLVYKKLGYIFFDEGDYNLNIIVIRENDFFENTFSDKLYVIYKVSGIWKILELPWTTLAGTLGFGGEQSPLTAAQTGTGQDGVAIILEGQYRRALKWIRNGWRYPFVKYLKQIKAFRYLRDNNRNYKIDRNLPVQVGIYQTHLHPMSPKGLFSKFVNYLFSPWSQGCMGCPEPDWRKLEELIELAIKMRPDLGDEFTLTILHRKDFEGL
jgi:hypothetical protein